MIKYAEVLDGSIVGGIGLRATAFLQGCPGPTILSKDQRIINVKESLEKGAVVELLIE